MAYRAIVTGAAGFIGSSLCDNLLAAGHDVVGIDCFTDYYDPAIKRRNIAAALRHDRFELLPVDLAAFDLAALLQPDDVVFHLAGQPGVRSSWNEGFAAHTRNNIEATQRLLEAVCRNPVRRVVFASSSSVYGDAPRPMIESGSTQPVSPYGVTKLTAERLCDVYRKNFGVQVSALRFFTVYGPRQRPDMAFNRFIKAIDAGDPITVFGDGSQQRDFTYIGDLVAILRGIAQLPECPPILNIGGGTSVALIDVLQELGRIMNKDPEIVFEPTAAGDVRHTEASTELLASLGLRTTRDVAYGLRQQVDWQLGAQTDAGLRGITARAGHPRRRVVLYSHDTFGLGHLRRNLAIADAIARRSDDVETVLISGSRCSDRWTLPPRTSVVRLPEAVKVGAETYDSTDLRPFSWLLGERSGMIASLLLRLRPDVFLVDHAPVGMKGELRPALAFLREHLPATKVYLGLRDIIDDPRIVRETWQAQNIHDALRQWYDRVLVYGSRELFDVVGEYQLPADIAAKVEFTGYIGKSPEMEAGLAADYWPAGGKRVLALGGGGGDATTLFDAVVRAWPQIAQAHDVSMLMVTGPYMSEPREQELREHARRLPRFSLLTFTDQMLKLIAEADLVVTMGGYNTVTEALSAGTPLIICPRTQPRVEQLIRATTLDRLGLARMVRLDTAGPAALGCEIDDALTSDARAAFKPGSVPLDGTAVVAALLADQQLPVAAG